MKIDYKNLLIIIILGIILLFSYYNTFNGQKSYFKSLFWLNLPKKTIKTLTIHQILAIIGFFIFIISWVIVEPPTNGIFVNKNILTILLILFFCGSICWCFCVKKSFTSSKNIFKILTVFSLILVAISTAIMLIGSITERHIRWYIILGLSWLSLTTIISDSIMWNARFIEIFSKKN